MELNCFTLIRSYFSFLWKFMILLLFIFEYGYILYNLFSSAYLFWFLQYLLFIHLFSKHWVHSIWQVPFLSIEQLTVNVKESVFKELTIWVFITLSVYQLVNYSSVPILECKHLEERDLVIFILGYLFAHQNMLYIVCIIIFIWWMDDFQLSNFSSLTKNIIILTSF